MRLTRYLKPPQVRLELETVMPEEKPEEWSESRFLWSVKSAILQELVGLLDASGKVSNPKRLFHDLENRERKATTGIGETGRVTGCRQRTSPLSTSSATRKLFRHRSDEPVLPASAFRTELERDSM